MALKVHQLQARDVPELDELEGPNVVTPCLSRRKVRRTSLARQGPSEFQTSPDTAFTVSMPYCSDAFPFVSTAIR